jgi:hypothetical protein
VKRIRLIVVFVMALVMLGAISGPASSAQGTYLDGVWLKCMVNAKGYIYDSGTESYKKKNGSIAAYLHFVWNVNHSNYDVAVWTNPNGGWVPSPSATANPAPGENFIPQFQLDFVVEGNYYIQTSHTPYIKYDQKGKVTYKGTGEVFGGVVGADQTYYGYFNISGTNVDPTKLPPGITP